MSSGENSSAVAKRKRGRPRKYDHIQNEPRRTTKAVQPQAVVMSSASQPPAEARPSIPATPSIPQDGARAKRNTPEIVLAHDIFPKASPAASAGQRSRGAVRSSDNLPSNLSHHQVSNKRKFSSISEAAAPIHTTGTGHAAYLLHPNTELDNLEGKHVYGILEKKIGTENRYLLKVRVGFDGPVLQGLVSDVRSIITVTPENDVAPQVPMIGRSQVQNPNYSCSSSSEAPVPASTSLTPITIAQPLQMREPKAKTPPRKTIGRPAKHYPSLPRTEAPNFVTSEMRNAAVSELQAKVVEVLGKKGSGHMTTQTGTAVALQNSMQTVPVSSISSGRKEAAKEITKVNEALPADQAIYKKWATGEAFKGNERSSGDIQPVSTTTIVDMAKEPTGAQVSAVLGGSEDRKGSERISEQPNAQISVVLTGSQGSKGADTTSGLKDNSNARHNQPQNTMEEAGHPNVQVFAVLTGCEGSKGANGASGPVQELDGKTSVCDVEMVASDQMEQLKIQTQKPAGTMASTVPGTTTQTTSGLYEVPCLPGDVHKTNAQTMEQIDVDLSAESQASQAKAVQAKTEI